MKKTLILLGVLILLVPSFLMSSQRYVVAELFTSTTCGSCPTARSALNQIYQDTDSFPYFIPVMWQQGGDHQSPGVFDRLFGFYNAGFFSYCQWGGTIPVVTSLNDTYDDYVAAYNQLVTQSSPLEIYPELFDNGQGQLVINAEVVLTADITTTDNRIQYILTYDLSGIMEPHYFASLKRYQQEEFTLTTQGEEGLFSYSFDIDPNWDLDMVKAVVMIQTFSGDKEILQAGTASVTDIVPPEAGFGSDITFGIAPLVVQFTDNSIPGSGEITFWHWDFGDAGVSFEQNPQVMFHLPGVYPVELTVIDVHNSSGTFEIADYVSVYPEGPLVTLLTEDHLEFGSGYTGSQSAYQTVGLINSGTENLTITSIHLSGETENFVFYHTVEELRDITLFPEEELAIYVSFTPQIEGDVSDTLYVINDSMNEAVLEISLNGFGIGAHPPRQPENVRITLEDGFVHLEWDPVTENIEGQAIVPDYYLIFYNDTSDIDGEFFLLGESPDPFYTDVSSLAISDKTFYRVKAVVIYGDTNIIGD